MTSPALQKLPDPTTVPTAGFLPRVAAYLVDQLVLLPLLLGIYFFTVERPLMPAIVVIWVIQTLYKPLTEWYFGRTLGKALIRLRVVDRGTNRRPSLNQSFVRYLPFAVAAFAGLFVTIRIFQSPELAEVSGLRDYGYYLRSFPLNQDFLISTLNNFPVFSAVWMIMDPWSRALHDRWAQTFVIRIPPVAKQ